VVYSFIGSAVVKDVILTEYLKYRAKLIMIRYEEDESACTPVTVHATTRKQVRFRTDAGMFR